MIDSFTSGLGDGYSINDEQRSVVENCSQFIDGLCAGEYEGQYSVSVDENSQNILFDVEFKDFIVREKYEDFHELLKWCEYFDVKHSKGRKAGLHIVFAFKGVWERSK